MRPPVQFFEAAYSLAVWREISFGLKECFLKAVTHLLPRLVPDLLSYGLALFHLGLELRAQDRTHKAAIDAFARAGEAIESVIRDGDPEFNERGFYTIIAAAAYHLAHFSARAFSLFPTEVESLNLSPTEHLFTLLLQRDLVKLRVTLLKTSGESGFDAALAANLVAAEGRAGRGEC